MEKLDQLEILIDDCSTSRAEAIMKMIEIITELYQNEAIYESTFARMMDAYSIMLMEAV